MRRQDRADHAGGTAGGAEAGEVEVDEQAFAVEAGEADVERVREGAVGVAVADGGGAGVADALPEPVAERGLARAFGVHRREGEFGGAGEADDGGGVLGAGAALVFVRTAVLQALDVVARAEEEQARAFGAVEFVGGE